MNAQFNYFHACASAFDCEFPYADRQLESPWPRTSGINEQNAVAVFTFRDMAVAGDHDVKSCGFRLEIELGNIVQHIDGNTA